MRSDPQPWRTCSCGNERPISDFVARSGVITTVCSLCRRFNDSFTEEELRMAIPPTTDYMVMNLRRIERELTSG